VHSSEAAAVDFYAFSTGVIPDGTIFDSKPGFSCPGDRDLVSHAAGARVWFVYGYHSSTSARDEEAAVLDRLRIDAHLLLEIARPDARAYLFDFAQAPDGSDGRASHLGCVGLSDDPPATPTGLHTGPFATGRKV
jgi:hypothetical protein